ncbi:hypothetical protein ACVXG7_06345 [Enterobacter hormaechei]
MIEKKETARKLNALPFMAHVLVADIAAEFRIFRVVTRIETAVI